MVTGIEGAAGDAEDYACDLPGCELAVRFAPEDADVWPPQVPPGWLSVMVARHGARSTTLTYCSQEHLATGVGEHLPEPVPPAPDDDDWKTDVLIGGVLLLVLIIAVLGVVSLVGLGLDLAGWTADRF